MTKEISCFKAYDVRGRIPSELNEDVAYRIGVGVASYFEAESVVVDSARQGAHHAARGKFLTFSQLGSEKGIQSKSE